MAQKNDRTNLASEFYVLSALYRVGLEPLLTMGNKKYVDILLSNGEKAVTIDVKGLASKSCWLFGDRVPLVNAHHYYLLVSFLGKIADNAVIPETYVVPSKLLRDIIKSTKKGIVVEYSTVKSQCQEYKDDWKRLVREMTE